MLDTVCTYPLPSDLFAQAIHPSEPLISVGLASGHVQTFRLPPLHSTAPTLDDSEISVLSNGCGTIDTLWRTRRHKGSCRSLAFSSNGEKLFSAGTEGLVKMAATETGQVEAKVWIPGGRPPSNPLVSTGDSPSSSDSPYLLHALSPQTLLLATDLGALHVYDLRNDAISAKPVQTHHPHDDPGYLSSISPIPASSESTSSFPKQWVSTGGTTLVVTDLRRGVMAKSEDQEEELMSSVFVPGLPKKGTSVGEKVLVGGSLGVITLWERGVWDDQDERVYVGGGECVDVLCAVPEGTVELGKGQHLVAAGLGDGQVRVVSVEQKKVLGQVRHDEMEGVVGLGFESEGRMVSGGGTVVKVWQEATHWEEGAVDGLLDGAGWEKRERESSDESDEDEDSSEEEKERKKRKKRKRNRGKDRSRGKQNGISFQGLD